MFGTYGRVGIWPCKSPFSRYPNVSGDLPACREVGARARLMATRLDEGAKLDWQYLQGVLKIYDEARDVMKARTFGIRQAESFHMKLFMHMAEFNLGPMLDRNLSKKLKAVRGKTEKRLMRTERVFAAGEMAPEEFLDEFDRTTLAFQSEMANAMMAGQYETLFELKPDDTVVLADREIFLRQHA
jgi:hypothetical protein